MPTHHFVNAHGLKLAAQLDLPQGDATAFAVFAHCFTCSKNLKSTAQISRTLAKHGIGVLRFDFTGLGSSEGSFEQTNVSGNVQDVVAAVGWLEGEGRPARLLVGHSLGGTAVLQAASVLPQIRAIATIGTPDHPRHIRSLIDPDPEALERSGCAEVTLAGRRFGMTRQFLDDLEQQSTQRALAQLARPLLVMHAPDDDVVPFAQGQRLFELATPPKSFVSLPGADHLLTSTTYTAYAASIIATWAAPYLRDEFRP